MDIIESPKYEDLQKIFTKYFALPKFGSDCSEKFALISLVCHLTELLKQKKPDITHWTVLYQINKQGNSSIPEDWLKGFAVICSEFAYGCNTFPTFGIENKDVPKKIKELLNQWLPF